MLQKKLKMKDSTTQERRFGVVLEDINKTVHQVLEGHAALDEKFSKKIDDFRYEMRDEIKLLKLSNYNLTNKIEDLTRSSKQILEYLSRIDEEIQDLKKVLVRKVDLERLLTVEKRVAQIELVVKKYLDGQNSN